MASLEQVRQAFAKSYAVEREVGQGGMATVYLAQDLKHHRQVALKVLRTDLSSTIGGDRFTREIQIIAQLAHPHILPLHDSGEMDGFLFYVMPFVEGESLRQRLAREGRLPLSDAVRILREVTDALAYAHERGIIHRDIKPDNVMLSGRHAVVTDFGVAKAVSAASVDKLTTVGIALGTPAYMSPEQAMGETDLDQRSDIYALGAMAFEMLSGEPPFNRPTAQAVLSAHVLDAPPDIATKRNDVPAALGEVLLRCLAKEKTSRWQTADELLPALEAALTPSGGMTPTTTRPLRAAQIGKHKRSKSLFVVIAVSVVIAVGSLAVWQFVGGSNDPGPNRMAILPIVDASGADAQLVTVMHNQLQVSLGQIPGVTVAPNSVMELYKSSPKPVAEMARELRVGAILEGNVFRAGQRLRVTLQLTNPRTIEQVWSGSYDIDLSQNLLDAIDKVIPQIRDGIRERVLASQ
ncbi:MAG TPA: serine/threonine-protein kinase [Gemmatimonadaceae bacterium]|nr:serine/threonine-protein kinase [Gemmatimonadaceae bacterium]